MYIRIEKNPDGSHAFQCGGHLENGWAVIPYDMEIPDTFPYVDIEVDTVTRPSIDGGADIIQLEVISMTEGKEIADHEAANQTGPVPAESGVSEDAIWDAMAAAYNEGVQSA